VDRRHGPASIAVASEYGMAGTRPTDELKAKAARHSDQFPGRDRWKPPSHLNGNRDGGYGDLLRSRDGLAMRRMRENNTGRPAIQRRASRSLECRPAAAGVLS
jgi:hypothetical protein